MQTRFLVTTLSLLAIAGLAGTLLERGEISDLQEENAAARQAVAAAQEDTQKAVAQSNAAAAEAVSVARTEADARIKEARQKAVDEETRADALLQTQEKRLANVFPDLRYVRPGPNVVGLKYVNSFEINGSALRVQLVNNAAMEVKPDFTIQFLNQYGFLTDSCGESWIFERIQPGETRVVNYQLNHPYGAAVYFVPQVR